MIFNYSFETGVVPEELKIAKVIPIHKKEKMFKYLLTTNRFL